MGLFDLLQLPQKVPTEEQSSHLELQNTSRAFEGVRRTPIKDDVP